MAKLSPSSANHRQTQHTENTRIMSSPKPEKRSARLFHEGAVMRKTKTLGRWASGWATMSPAGELNVYAHRGAKDILAVCTCGVSPPGEKAGCGLLGVPEAGREGRGAARVAVNRKSPSRPHTCVYAVEGAHARASRGERLFHLKKPCAPSSTPSDPKTNPTLFEPLNRSPRHRPAQRRSTSSRWPRPSSRGAKSARQTCCW